MQGKGVSTLVMSGAGNYFLGALLLEQQQRFPVVTVGNAHTLFQMPRMDLT